VTREKLKKWFVYDYRNVVGPLTTEELKFLVESGRFEEIDLYWTRGQKEWAPMSTWTDQEVGAEDQVWYVSSGGFNDGPYSLTEIVDFLKIGEIPMTSKMWTEGLRRWATIFEMQQLTEALGISRRKHPRVPLRANVRLTTPVGDVLAEACTLSKGGLGLRGSMGFRNGQEISVMIEEAALGRPVYAKARVVYSSNNDTGLEFTSLSAENESAVVEYIQQFQV
jgi:hypothetical protein